MIFTKWMKRNTKNYERISNETIPKNSWKNELNTESGNNAVILNIDNHVNEILPHPAKTQLIS